jgi:hypothetical protein
MEKLAVAQTGLGGGAARIERCLVKTLEHPATMGEPDVGEVFPGIAQNRREQLGEGHVGGH